MRGEKRKSNNRADSIYFRVFFSAFLFLIFYHLFFLQKELVRHRGGLCDRFMCDSLTYDWTLISTAQDINSAADDRCVCVCVLFISSTL